MNSSQRVGFDYVIYLSLLFFHFRKTDPYDPESFSVIIRSPFITWTANTACCTADMPVYKLTYFGIKSRGEIIRLAFAAAGVEFEDFRISPATYLQDWPPIKAS